MLPDFMVAVFLTACLAVFCSVGLYNLLKSSYVRESKKSTTEIEKPYGLAFILASFGTLTFYLESTFYIILIFADQYWIFRNSFLQLQFFFDSQVRLLGIITTCFGYALFIWSILARGRFATSWEMPEDQKLVTWGPYRYMRHPSYLAYFILFAGFFMMILNLLAILPLMAIPGYILIVDREEELLIRRFGESYLEYRRTTGKFLPKVKL